MGLEEAVKLISILSPTFNEEDNVREIYRQLKEVLSSLDGYEYEIIFIDNASTDNTVPLLKEIASEDKNVRIIVNNRNYGHIRSPYHGLLQTKGDAVILLASDLQDPPELISEFIKEWEKGYKLVLGVKDKSEETLLMFIIRCIYYQLVGKLADKDLALIKNHTGFGLYDKEVINMLRKIDDPYPYLRGLICDLGYEQKIIKYTQRARKRGITKNNFYTLYDMAMLGITNHTKVPLRIATISGFVLSALSLLVSLVYFSLKMIFWNYISFGFAPMIIGLFFFASVQLFFIGIIGEYIGFIHTQILNRPKVIEKERINFD